MRKLYKTASKTGILRIRDVLGVALKDNMPHYVKIQFEESKETKLKCKHFYLKRGG